MTEEVQNINEEVVVSNVKDTKGIFVDNLERRNSKIKLDRAKAIAQDAEFTFKRDVEDIKNRIRRLTRDREDMLDLSGENAFSTMPTAGDFNDAQFSIDYRKISLKIRDLQIEFEVAKDDYYYLFGKEFK